MTPFFISNMVRIFFTLSSGQPGMSFVAYNGFYFSDDIYLSAWINSLVFICFGTLAINGFPSKAIMNPPSFTCCWLVKGYAMPLLFDFPTANIRNWKQI
jgi:hypothetical protein